MRILGHKRSLRMANSFLSFRVLQDGIVRCQNLFADDSSIAQAPLRCNRVFRTAGQAGSPAAKAARAA